MTIATLNDVKIYYEVHGAGTPLVLIAGFGQDHTTSQVCTIPEVAHVAHVETTNLFLLNVKKFLSIN